MTTVTFEDAMGHLRCSACDLPPHPHTATLLKAGDRCNRSECGKGFYVDRRDELKD